MVTNTVIDAWFEPYEDSAVAPNKCTVENAVEKTRTGRCYPLTCPTFR